MARIPGSGPIDMGMVNSEFGFGTDMQSYLSAPHDQFPCVFTSGPDISFQDFRNKARIPNPAALTTSMNADPNCLQSFFVNGTRSPADKIQNYLFATNDYGPRQALGNFSLITQNQNLVEGVKYCYTLTTSGIRTGNRNLANGTQIFSQAYNGASSAPENLITYENFRDFGVGYTVSTGRLSSVGTFTYNPRLITTGSGELVGHLLAGFTYNASDPGKGGATIVVHNYCYFLQLCTTYGIPFIDNNNNAP
jgi:CubicO group peptidase (beta-lactamase class C family)